MRFVKLFAMIGVALLAGCASVPGGNRYAVSTLTIDKPITIPVGAARVFFQKGTVRPYGRVSWYDQWCALEVRSLTDAPRTVRPGDYRITRVQLDEVEIAFKQPVQLAFAGDRRLLAGLFYASGSNSLPPPTMDVVHFYLKGPDADVLRLSCGGALSDGRPSDGPARVRPDVATINRLLGGFAHLH